MNIQRPSRSRPLASALFVAIMSLGLFPWNAASAPATAPTNEWIAMVADSNMDVAFSNSLAQLERQAASEQNPVERERVTVSMANLLLERGQALARSARYVDAVPLLRRAGELLRESRWGRFSDLALELSRVYLAGGSGQPAQDWARQARQSAAATGNLTNEAMAIVCEGMAERLLGRAARAEELLNEALKRSSVSKAAHAEVAALLGLGAMALDRAQAPGAAKLFAEAAGKAGRVENAELESNAWNGLGAAQISRHRFLDASNSFERAMSIAQVARNVDAYSEALGNMGALLMSMGNAGAARQYFADGLFARRVLKDRRGEGVSLANLAEAGAALGNYRAAREAFEQSLAIAREQSDFRGAVARHNNLGKLYGLLGNADKAQEHFEQAQRLEREHSIPGAYLTLNNLGTVLVARREFGRALSILSNAWQLARVANDPDAEANTANNIAVALRDVGRHADGLRVLDRALVTAQDAGNRALEGAIWNNRAVALRSLGRLAEACDALAQAMIAARETGDVSLEASTLNNLMIVWQLRGNFTLATLHGKQAINAYQRARRELTGWDTDTRREYLKTRENAYRVLAELLINQGRLLEAMHVLDLLKEEQFQLVRAGQGSETLNSQERDVHQRYLEIVDRLVLLARERRELFEARYERELNEAEKLRLRQLDDDMEVSGEVFVKFEEEVRQALASRSGVKNNLPLEKIESLPRELGGDFAVIYTMVSDEKLFVILATPDVLLAVTNSIKRVDLDARVAAMQAALRNPSVDPTGPARSVYEAFLAPLENHLTNSGATGVACSLDRSLSGIPIAALHDRNGYLVERFRSTVITAASSGQLEKPPSAKWRVFALGVSEEREGFVPLPGVSNELYGIVKTGESSVGLLPGRIHLNTNFTSDNLRRAFQQGPVVHIASHFHVEPAEKRMSFLLLGDLSASKLLMSSFDKWPHSDFQNLELVTLSACNTAVSAVSTDTNGNRLESFAAEVQSKGARAVLGTLWMVNDDSTQQLMRDFYRRRGQGKPISKSEALRQAQLALLHGGQTETEPLLAVRGTVKRGQSYKRDPARPYAHPYFWAPFVLVGNPR